MSRIRHSASLIAIAAYALQGICGHALHDARCDGCDSPHGDEVRTHAGSACSHRHTGHCRHAHADGKQRPEHPPAEKGHHDPSRCSMCRILGQPQLAAETEPPEVFQFVMPYHVAVALPAKPLIRSFRLLTRGPPIG